MGRNLSAPTAAVRDVNYVVPVAKGGTGASTVSGAIANLGAISNTKLGVANGVAKSDANTLALAAQLPSGIVNGVALSGSSLVSVNQTIQWTISNYDTSTTYAVSASAGSISQSNGVVTYIAPSASGAQTITINGRVINIYVDVNRPIQPSLAVTLSEYNGTVNGLTAIIGTFNSSAYTNNGGSATQKSTDWEVATDPAFSSIVSSSYGDTINLTGFASAPVLVIGTTYYARVRYQDSNNNKSEWSSTLKFTAVYISSGAVTAKLLAPDAAASDYFSTHIAISSDGSRLVVGTPGRNTTTGTAYIFSRTGSSWSLESKIVASDAATTSNFGNNVAISDDGSRVAIGSYTKVGTVANQGAVYIFTRTGYTWAQETKLLASDPVANDYFGYRVSMSGDGTRVLIGAYNKTGTVSLQGAAYVFTRTGVTWAQETKLLASDPAANDYFGNTVALSGDGTRAVVGAYNKTGTVTVQGAIYVFLRTGVTWTQEAKIISTEPAASDMFGIGLAIDTYGLRIAVGAYNKTGTAGVTQGAAYVFARTITTWAQEAKLLAQAPVTADYAGQSMCISGDGTIVSMGVPGRLSSKGTLQTFVKTATGWFYRITYTSSDGAAADMFGANASISRDGTTISIAAPNKTGVAGTLQGAAYIYAT